MGDAEASSKEQPGELDPPELAAPRAPDKTTNELDVGWGEAPHEADHRSDDDEQLLRERPPHWEH